ncbi:uncharacterized protein K02A2.6 [Trichonephila clavipes]|nr:uncharacterized protein K02A2.6 [Trichonephila clavipes]
MSSPGFEPRPNGTKVSVANHYTEWATIAECKYIDSKSAIEAIRNGETNISCDIITLLEQLHSKRKSCILQWIPAHVNIEGNECADSLAKEARDIEHISAPPSHLMMLTQKVDSSEWATPVVPVVKSDGSIRLCADYSVTLNPNLIVPQHPLPRLDEIFDGSERPIAFASRTLSGSEKKYSQIDKEALSIVWAVKKFYLYLKGRRFTLITDHKPSIAIFGSKRDLPVLAATRLLHYALILRSFEFDIIFRKTIEHGNADFLPRLPKTSEELEVKDDITIFQMSQIEALPVTSKELRQETSKDIELGPLLRALREGKDLQGGSPVYH